MLLLLVLPVALALSVVCVTAVLFIYTVYMYIDNSVLSDFYSFIHSLIACLRILRIQGKEMYLYECAEEMEAMVNGHYYPIFTTSFSLFQFMEKADPDLELVLCSGHGKNGSLSVLQHTIRPQVVTTFELPGCTNMWTVLSETKEVCVSVCFKYTTGGGVWF